MHTGIDFLRDQVDEAMALHAALIESMTSHESEANDNRYRDLCFRHIAHMREHQAMLKQFRATLGERAGSPTPADVIGVVKRAAGTAFGVARSLADSSQSDYNRLVADLALVRQLEVSFRTFRDAGRHLGVSQLAQLGAIAERHHDDYSAEAKRLVTQMFVERAKDAAPMAKPMTDRPADSPG